MEKYGDAAEAEIVETTERLKTSCARLGNKLQDIALTDLEEQIAMALESGPYIITRFSSSESAAAKYGVRLDYDTGSAIDIIIEPREA